jgi:hypothetical protein
MRKTARRGRGQEGNDGQTCSSGLINVLRNVSSALPDSPELTSRPGRDRCPHFGIEARENRRGGPGGQRPRPGGAATGHGLSQSGTSYAGAHVAGVILLLQQKVRELTRIFRSDNCDHLPEVDFIEKGERAPEDTRRDVRVLGVPIR